MRYNKGRGTIQNKIVPCETMNKQTFPGIIVVEGASDVALISSFLNADIVTTNGSEVSRETISFLKEASKTRDVVVLTDPDTPGKRIRDMLDQEIPGLKHAFILKSHAIKHGKVGVAESSKADILEALSHIVPSKNENTTDVTYSDLYDFGLIGNDSSQEKRDMLERKLHIGHCNGKTLLKRIKALGLTKEKLKEVLHG